MGTKYKLSAHLRPTLVLLLVLAAVTLGAILRIEGIIEARCFEILNDTVEQGATNIRALLESGEQQMDVVADMLAEHPGLNEEICQRYLDHLHTDGLITSYAVLLPNGQMVYASSGEVQLDAPPDFGEESRKGDRFVSRYIDRPGGEYAAYISTIVKDGAAAGVLYGYVRLSDLPDKFTFSAFDGECKLYLIDGGTGHFLMDTWHEALGNMYDESLAKRKTKLGTDFDQMREDVVNETPGYVVFESKTVGEDFYSCYYPVGKYHLSFQVTVSRPVAFAEADHIQKVVLVLGLVLFAAVAVYVLVLFKKARQKDRQDKKELALNRAMNEVQRTLFGVYKNPYLIQVSMETLERAIGSEQIVLMLLNNGVIEKSFGLPILDDQEKEHVIGAKLPSVVLEDIGTRLEEKGMTLDGNSDREKLKQIKEMPGLEATETVRNLAAVWVLNANKDIIGLLYAVNVDDPESSRAALSTVVNSFQLAIQTMDSYNLLYRMGEFDEMTGLKNRNAYQKDLPNYDRDRRDRLCCVYLDANGLHDLNNSFGHASGDRMLSSIGGVVREMFGFQGSYRIGGDEFVIFSMDPTEVLQERIQAMKARLEQMEYYVSAGLAFREEGQPVHQLIIAAESAMYQQKKAFYTGARDRRKARQKNQELERALMAKKDQESFLSAIAANYLGVYAVNLDTDVTRTIYKPTYFDEILRKTQYRYQSAICEYAQRFVSQGDYDAFMDFLNYETIKAKIGGGYILECIYQKKNGDTVRVRILPTEGYGEDGKDTLWIFEKYSVGQAQGGPVQGDE